MRLNRLKIVLTLNFLVVTVDVLPVWLYFSSFLFCCSVLFFNHEAIYTIRVLAVFDVYYRKLTIEPSVKTFKTRTVHFIFSLSIFVCVHVIITSITALGMSVNLCLVLRFFCYLPAHLFRNFTFN